MSVAGPVDCGACSLEHGIGATVAGVEVLHDFLPQAGWDHRSVIVEDNIAQCREAMAGPEIGF